MDFSTFNNLFPSHREKLPLISDGVIYGDDQRVVAIICIEEMKRLLTPKIFYAKRILKRTTILSEERINLFLSFLSEMIERENLEIKEWKRSFKKLSDCVISNFHEIESSLIIRYLRKLVFDFGKRQYHRTFGVINSIEKEIENLSREPNADNEEILPIIEEFPLPSPGEEKLIAMEEMEDFFPKTRRMYTLLMCE